MYTYNSNGQKVAVNEQNTAQPKMGFGSMDKKQKKMVWIIVALIALIILAVVIYMMMKKRKENYSSMNFARRNPPSFGFSFY